MYNEIDQDQYDISFVLQKAKEPAAHKNQDLKYTSTQRSRSAIRDGTSGFDQRDSDHRGEQRKTAKSSVRQHDSANHYQKSPDAAAINRINNQTNQSSMFSFSLCAGSQESTTNSTVTRPLLTRKVLKPKQIMRNTSHSTLPTE